MKAKIPPLPARFAVMRLPNPPPAWEGNRVDYVIAAVWTFGVLIWTVARFIIPLVVFWQFLRMMWFWNTPGAHAGWNFLAYFAGYTALYYFVAFYRPKALRDRDLNRGGRNARK